MTRFLDDKAMMKLTCILCNYSVHYTATEEQFEAYVQREKDLGQVFPDLPLQAVAILDNGLYCEECLTKSYDERIKLLAKKQVG